MKIILFGDSLTEGSYGGSYFDELVKLMPEHDLINAGVGGNTVINLLRRVDEDVLAHEPDAVLVMVGGNDAISYSQPKTRSYYQRAMEIDEGFVTPEQFEQAYRDLLTKLQLEHVIVWVGLEPNEYNPTTRDALLDYNARARSVARTFNLPVLDLMDAFEQPEPLPERPELGIDTILTIGAREKRGWNDYETARQAGGFTYTFDGLHLTPESAQQTAEWIAAFIREN